nr:uncharacterized protein LOC109730909 [Microcebus murinus]
MADLLTAGVRGRRLGPGGGSGQHRGGLRRQGQPAHPGAVAGSGGVPSGCGARRHEPPAGLRARPPGVSPPPSLHRPIRSGEGHQARDIGLSLRCCPKSWFSRQVTVVGTRNLRRREGGTVASFSSSSPGASGFLPGLPSGERRPGPSLSRSRRGSARLCDQGIGGIKVFDIRQSSGCYFCVHGMSFESLLSKQLPSIGRARCQTGS